MSDKNTNLTKKTSLEKSWLKCKPEGHTLFAMIPVSMLLHPDVSNADLRVFACLAAHANRAGWVYISRQRIAEMCGFWQKGEPNVQYVSRFLGQKSGTLIRLGFVKNLGQRGMDECCEYQLMTPDFLKSGVSPLRKVTALRKANYKEQKRKAVDAKEAAQVFKLRGELTDVIEYEGEIISRRQVLNDLRDWHAGFERLFPNAVYAAFAITIPALREPDDF